MHRPMLLKAFIIFSHYLLNNFTAIIIKATIKSKIESRLIKCMALTFVDFGLLGSFFFKKRYSAIWLKIPISINC